MSNSGLTQYQDELLTILTEECGEVIQELCKIERFGINELSHHHPDKTHLQCLKQELGDLLACIQLLEDANIGITNDDLCEAKQLKLNKMGKWMTHKKPVTDNEAIDEIMRKTMVLAKRQLDNYKVSK